MWSQRGLKWWRHKNWRLHYHFGKKNGIVKWEGPKWGIPNGRVRFWRTLKSDNFPKGCESRTSRMIRTIGIVHLRAYHFLSMMLECLLFFFSSDALRIANVRRRGVVAGGGKKQFKRRGSCFKMSVRCSCQLRAKNQQYDETFPLPDKRHTSR